MRASASSAAARTSVRGSAVPPAQFGSRPLGAADGQRSRVIHVVVSIDRRQIQQKFLQVDPNAARAAMRRPNLQRRIEKGARRWPEASRDLSCPRARQRTRF
jgi:hypothetical protein